MQIITINDDNLTIDKVDQFTSKSRAILLDDNKILVANYGGVTLLPGGTVQKEETSLNALVRELEEETGIIYDKVDLQLLFNIKHYQRDYPTRNNEKINRMVNTTYYISEFRGVNYNNVNMTEQEEIDGFNLELIDIDRLSEKIKLETHNPRKRYFDREIEETYKLLKKIR